VSAAGDPRDPERRIGYAERPGRATVVPWGLALAAPAAFLVALAVRYLFSPAACGAAWARIALEAAGALGVLAAAAPGVLSWRRIAALGIPRTEAVDPQGSTQLLLALGVLLSAVFTLAALALWIPSWILHPCMD